MSKPKPSYLKTIYHTHKSCPLNHVSWGSIFRISEKNKFSARPDNPVPQAGLSALMTDRIIRSVRADYPGQNGFLSFKRGEGTGWTGHSTSPSNPAPLQPQRRRQSLPLVSGGLPPLESVGWPWERPPYCPASSPPRHCPYHGG